jgi:putative transposase
MFDLVTLLQCATVCLDTTTWRQLTVIVPAIFALTGRVTMLGISRWTGPGGSYRTVQRFFNAAINWGVLHWVLVKTHLLDPQDTYILAGDEVVVTKAGHDTHGLNRFFSSLYGKPVPGLAFFTLSLVSVQRRVAYPLRIGQIIRPATPPEPAPAPPPPAKKPGGRPKGSKNRNKEQVELSPYLVFIQSLVRALLLTLSVDLAIRYLVLDGAFGHNDALQMVRQCGLQLISKLPVNSALYLPYAGPYSGHGPHRKYGAKINYRQIPAQYRQETRVEDGMRSEIYQLPLLHKLFAQSLNVVIIVKTNLQTGAQAHVILFSSDLQLSYEQIIDYYKLRFQIEFNFRDAKQYWGLEDFMNVKETPLTNAVNLAFLMVNLSQVLLQEVRVQHPQWSVQDLKAHYRGLKYVTETLKLLPQKPDPILIQQITAKVAQIGSINAT